MAERKRPPNSTAPDGAILVINSGSSSVKFALFSGPQPALSSTDSRTNSGLRSGQWTRTASAASRPAPYLPAERWALARMDAR